MSISVRIGVEYGQVFDRISTADLRAYLQLKDFADAFVGPPHRQDCHRVRMSRICSHKVAIEGDAWEDELLEEISDARIMRHVAAMHPERLAEAFKALPIADELNRLLDARADGKPIDGQLQSIGWNYLNRMVIYAH